MEQPTNTIKSHVSIVTINIDQRVYLTGFVNSKVQLSTKSCKDLIDFFRKSLRTFYTIKPELFESFISNFYFFLKKKIDF